MPIYDKALLAAQARQLGFLTAPFEKMSRLIEILRFLNDTKELRETLALKGGTAINLTVFNLPRLSVDIDLDFTENMTKEETQIQRDKINKILGRYMRAEGYIEKGKSKRTHILDSFVYSYVNASGNNDNIKVEINYALRSHVLLPLQVSTQTLDLFDAAPIRILHPVEIFASKLVALMDRAAARDLYDLYNMIYHGLFDEPDIILLRKCAVFYMAIAGDITAMGFSFARVKSITTYKIKTDLQPMIRHNERFNLHVSLERVSSFFKEWMDLTDSEVAFLTYFAHGRYEPQLLFEDEAIVKRIKNHPMAVWRLQHIRHEQAEQ